MSEDSFRRLARVLDTLPNGFPATPDGLEIRILQKIFTPEEADLACDLRLTPETAPQIAGRTGRPLDGLEEMLSLMWEKGEILRVVLGGTPYFRLIPWVIGIYELQLKRMDRQFAELAEKYSPYMGLQMISHGPPIMQVIPVEREIPVEHRPLRYEQVSAIIEGGKSFALHECICKKERGLLDKPCPKPLEVCMAIAPVPGVFADNPRGREISREEAYQVLRTAEEAGLVHMTMNVQDGHYFICNCCGCCCGILRGINLLGKAQGLVNAHFRAEIDAQRCVACGVCAHERCQVRAISGQDGAYVVDRRRCIGCGLCVTTCPSEAIRLVHKGGDELSVPPEDEAQWMEVRGRSRGVDYSSLK
jgi:ferredoxin